MIEKQLKFGDVVLIEVPFVEKEETKLRPALVLFEEFDNVVIAGITSNLKMDGIYLPKEEGLITDSILKLNYIFTISKTKIKRKLTHLSEGKKKEVCKELAKKLKACKFTL
jgi:mRNA interferase MazF